MIKKIEFIPMSSKYKEHLHKIVPSYKTIPDWYKKIPSNVKNAPHYQLDNVNFSMTNQTVKSCPPFLDAMTTGYMYTLPFDVEFSIEENGTQGFKWRVETECVSTHNSEQFPNVKNTEAQDSKNIFKWFSPFGIKTPPGYSVFFTHPINRFDLPFRTFSGVVETDVYHNAVQFPFMVTTEATKKKPIIIIEKGTPLAQFFPFKRERWQAQNHEYDKEVELKLEDKFFSRIYRSYKTHYWKRKSYQ
jgi:hypothetical protein